MALLLLVFLFQSGLACAFTVFIVRLVVRGTPQSECRKTLKGLRRLRNGMAVFALLLPVLVCGAFLASLPDGEPRSGALWPSLWAGMIMGAVALALAIVTREFGERFNR